jgi:hypothetical protein
MPPMDMAAIPSENVYRSAKIHPVTKAVAQPVGTATIAKLKTLPTLTFIPGTQATTTVATRVKTIQIVAKPISGNIGFY